MAPTNAPTVDMDIVTIIYRDLLTAGQPGGGKSGLLNCLEASGQITDRRDGN